MQVYAILCGKPMSDGTVPKYSITYMTCNADDAFDKLEALSRNEHFERIDAYTFKFKPSGEHIFIKSLVCIKD